MEDGYGISRREVLQGEYNNTANYVRRNGVMPPGMKRPFVGGGGGKLDFLRNNPFNGNNLVN